MKAVTTCTSCGSEIGPGAPSTHCPRCLLALAFPSVNGSSGQARPHLERLIGDYELGEQIGRGGMGAVYRARQLSLNREVALKMVLPAEATKPEGIKRFQIEAEAAAKLHHPNI